jgi:hypothetical protein
MSARKSILFYQFVHETKGGTQWQKRRRQLSASKMSLR